MRYKQSEIIAGGVVSIGVATVVALLVLAVAAFFERLIAPGPLTALAQAPAQAAERWYSWRDPDSPPGYLGICYGYGNIPVACHTVLVGAVLTAQPTQPPATPVPNTATPAPSTPTRAATATPAPTATPGAVPSATGAPSAALSNPGFEQGLSGWLTYPLAPSVKFNLEDGGPPTPGVPGGGALLVESGQYSLRMARDEFSQAPPRLEAGAMGRVTGLVPGQTLTVACRAFGVQGSTYPFSLIVDGQEQGNRIRSIYSRFRVGFNAAGYGNTQDPNVLRAGQFVVWAAKGLDYQWTEVAVSERVFASQVPLFLEVKIGDDWSAFPFAAGVVDSCAVSAQ